MSMQKMVPLDVMARSPKTYAECERAAVNAIPVADLAERWECTEVECGFWYDENESNGCCASCDTPLRRIYIYRPEAT